MIYIYTYIYIYHIYIHIRYITYIYILNTAPPNNTHLKYFFIIRGIFIIGEPKRTLIIN